MLVSESTIEPVLLDVRLQAEDFYRDRHRTIYEAIIRLNEDANPVDVLTVSEAARQARPARRDRRPRRRRQPGREGPRPRQRQALRADRQAELADAPPRSGGEDDPAVSRRARWRALGDGRAGRAPPLPGRPRGARRRLPRDRRDPPRRDRQARGARQRHLRHHRHPLRLPRPRRQDRRLPARQPDRDRGEAGDGQIDPGLRLRPERRDQAQQAGRPLLPGDVGDGARPPLHRLAVADLLATGCARARSRRRTGRRSSRPATSSSRRRSGSTTPPTSACSSCAPRRGACTPRRRAAGTTASGW